MEVEDPEIPVSVLGMGLIVSLSYVAAPRTADLQITYTSHGLPGDGLHRGGHPFGAGWRDPDVDAVEIEVVWDPVWTKARLRDDARSKMRSLGIAV